MTPQVQPLRTPSQLGLLLRSARKARKITQGQLAVRMGVSQSRVSQLELRPQDMTVEQLLSACAGLGLDLQVAERGAPPASAPKPAQGTPKAAKRVAPQAPGGQKAPRKGVW